MKIEVRLKASDDNKNVRIILEVFIFIILLFFLLFVGSVYMKNVLTWVGSTLNNFIVFIARLPLFFA